MLELLAILLISLLWAFLAGNLSFYNLLLGALLGLLLLSIVQREGKYALPRRVLAFIRFFLSFLKELIMANVMIAWLAVKPKPALHPHILAVPLTVKSDAAITLLSATITLLPGTVAMGCSADRRLLYAHAIGEADLPKAHDNVLRIERLILGFMT